MKIALQAVIFDMDGVLINSEPLWRRAMIKGFEEINIPFTEEDCRKTMGKRFSEVAVYWLNYFKIDFISAADFEARVISILIDLIENEGAMIAGIPEILAFCKEKNLKTGLATSSSNLLMDTVLKKLNLAGKLDAVVSAEFMKHGKPHPEVFLACAEMLNTAPQECIVIEDSLNGVISAKAAQMTVVAVPDEEHRQVPRFVLADYHLNSMHGVLALFKSLWP